MSRREDTRSPRQRFTALVQAELDFRKQEYGWSVNRFIAESKTPRPTLYEWLNTESDRMPKIESVTRYAENLKVPVAPYLEALGWAETPSEPAPPHDLVGFIRRARALAGHPKTSPDRRRVLEARIEAAEAALEAARNMEKSAESLLREALGESEDADR